MFFYILNMSERETNSPKEDKKMATQHALAAKAIKAEIKAMAPGAKISAKSESYSMGCSVNVKVIADVDEATKQKIAKLQSN